MHGNKKFILYRFVGVVNFMNIEHHEEKLKALPEVDEIILSLRYVYLVDLESVGALKHMFERLENRVGVPMLTGVNE